MARPESVALGGYFKTPRNITELIAGLFAVEKKGGEKTYNLFDPCAGDGEALVDFSTAVFPKQKRSYYSYDCRPRLYANELEEERYEALSDRILKIGGAIHETTHGDAFNIEFKDPRINVLWLNPPYDAIKGGGRLETKFLVRFTQTLLPEYGILVYIIPHYALEDCAQYVAEQYDSVRCYKFPEEDFKAFKQVVLIAARRKEPAMFTDKRTEKMLVDFSKSAVDIPVLDSSFSSLTAQYLIAKDAPAFKMEMKKIDSRKVYENFLPFRMGNGKNESIVRGLGLERDINEMIGAVYPVVVSPKPVHVATALASGLVNGQMVRPDKQGTGLPPLMVKGVFEREFRKLSENINEDGETTSEIHVQQPKLSVTILDMEKWEYHDLASGSEPTETVNLAEMNIADLLHFYGMALADLMYENCPPLHDPVKQIPMLPLGLEPYEIQRQSIIATLKVFFTDDETFVSEHPFILGEVGTGKTLVSLAVANAMSPANFKVTERDLAAVGISGGGMKPVNNMLVMCPPHLLKSWKDETKKVLPAARFVILSGISDVEAAAALPPNKSFGIGGNLNIFVMSRETAKLGHKRVAALESGKHLSARRCPGCGKIHSASNASIVSTRKRCDKTTTRAANVWARLAISWATRIAHVDPNNEFVDGLIEGNVARRMLRKLKTAVNDTEFNKEDAWHEALEGNKHFGETFLGRLIVKLSSRIVDLIREPDEEKREAGFDEALLLLRLLISAFLVADFPGRDRAIAVVASAFFAASKIDTEPYGKAGTFRKHLPGLLLIMSESGSKLQVETFAAAKADWPGMEWTKSAIDVRRLKALRLGTPNSDWARSEVYHKDGRIQWTKERIVHGSPKAGILLLETLASLGEFEESHVCDTPLYGGVPKPRRIPLATYICKRFPNLFDILVIDEAHEYNGMGSAQEIAAHRLTELGKPTMILTGTSNNGYAHSLFINMWSLSRRFRREYDRDQLTEFVDRYGYRKILVEAVEDQIASTPEYGSISDRVHNGVGVKMRKLSPAPGVLPLFVLKHLLTVAVPMHKSDLDNDLPPKIEIGEPMAAGGGLFDQYEKLQDTLVERIFEDMKDEDLSGKLWGQMTHLPTYLDRAHSDTGNALMKDGRHRYEIRYPENVGRELVAAAKPFDSVSLTTKEDWMLDILRGELAEKRPCAVLVWNTGGGLPARVGRIIDEEFGAGTSIFMDSGKVAASKRQDWITDKIVKPGKKVMIVNPTAVQTGLNNLTYFPTAIWFQLLPSCSSIVYDQTNGRFHRPGQLHDEVRVFVPYFDETAQEAQFYLLGRKVLASRQTDGVDISSALLAAGADEQDLVDTMAVGQAIYELVKNRHKPPKQDFATYKLNGRHAAKQPPTNEIQKTAFESLVKQSPKPVVIEMPKFGEYVGVQLSLFDS